MGLPTPILSKFEKICYFEILEKIGIIYAFTYYVDTLLVRILEAIYDCVCPEKNENIEICISLMSYPIVVV
jgi:hypothetical protein